MYFYNTSHNANLLHIDGTLSGQSAVTHSSLEESLTQIAVFGNRCDDRVVVTCYIGSKTANDKQGRNLYVPYHVVTQGDMCIPRLKYFKFTQLPEPP